MKRALLAILAVTAMVVLSRPAKADTIYAGGISYTFNYAGVDSANVYDVQLVIDTTNANLSEYLRSFSVQFTGATSVAMEYASAGTWSELMTGPNTAHGCNQNPGDHWCTDIVTPASGLSVPGGVYTFVFDVTMPAGTPVPTMTHIQAFQGNGLAISTDDRIGPPVPEPGSLALLGTGLLGVAGFIRRKLSA